jgi:DNA-binding transcriptional MerR regulator
MTVIDGEVFLTTSEVAMRFGVTPRTILRWHLNNPTKLGAITGLNGRQYYRKAEVDEMIQSVFFRGSSNREKKDKQQSNRSPELAHV